MEPPYFRGRAHLGRAYRGLPGPGEGEGPGPAQGRRAAGAWAAEVSRGHITHLWAAKIDSLEVATQNSSFYLAVVF